MEKLYGLIGYPLSHSFSKKYFTEKFLREGITNSVYELFPIETISLLPELLRKHPNLRGINVTIPFKETVIPYLSRVSEAAESIGAVNTIKVDSDGSLSGFNTDVIGFSQSLCNHIFFKELEKNALILGFGGSARAVASALNTLGFSITIASRQNNALLPYPSLIYSDITEEAIAQYSLIVNTTPLGMYPNVLQCPEIPYGGLHNRQLLMDLVYNPAETRFLELGKKAGAHTLNGAEMLVLQAEAAWEIWNEKPL
jgi:shikimate dehydrogenase